MKIIVVIISVLFLLVFAGLANAGAVCGSEIENSTAGVCDVQLYLVDGSQSQTVDYPLSGLTCAYTWYDSRNLAFTSGIMTENRTGYYNATIPLGSTGAPNLTVFGQHTFDYNCSSSDAAYIILGNLKPVVVQTLSTTLANQTNQSQANIEARISSEVENSTASVNGSLNAINSSVFSEVKVQARGVNASIENATAGLNNTQNRYFAADMSAFGQNTSLVLASLFNATYTDGLATIDASVENSTGYLNTNITNISVMGQRILGNLTALNSSVANLTCSAGDSSSMWNSTTSYTYLAANGTENVTHTMPVLLSTTTSKVVAYSQAQTNFLVNVFTVMIVVVMGAFILYLAQAVLKAVLAAGTSWKRRQQGDYD